MFPGAHNIIYRNEAGEVLGWDAPAEPDYDPYDDLYYDPDDVTYRHEKTWDEGATWTEVATGLTSEEVAELREAREPFTRQRFLREV